MSVKWIKDVDSGELFPIVDEEADFDIPEHLKACERTVVDYEKTTKNTIADLQEQLTAAQEQIDIYKNVHADELPKEFFEEIQQHRIFQQHSTLTEKPKHFAIDKSWFLYIVLVMVVGFTFFLGVKYFCDNVDFSTVNTSEQTVAHQEAAVTDEETEESSEGFDFLRPLMCVGLTILGAQFAVRFLRHALEGA